MPSQNTLIINFTRADITVFKTYPDQYTAAKNIHRRIRNLVQNTSKIFKNHKKLIHCSYHFLLMRNTNP